MIPVNQLAWESDRWQRELQQAFRSSRALLAYLDTQVEDPCHTPDFPVLVPERFARRMRPGDPNDPLLRQVLATQAEHELTPGFAHDPLLEVGLADDSALLQKYAHRALLITSSGCAINCRYCFRRHFPYSAHRDGHYQRSLDQIRADRSLNEIILSGGDPMVLPDTPLLQLIEQIDGIPHVNCIRIHSRLPVVLPNRVTPELLAGLAATRSKVVLVIHANHAQELAEDTARAFTQLSAIGVLLLNQSVLLRGVNDRVEHLVQLSRTLFDQGVMPYYLHLPDHVQGTGHFYVDDDAAKGLHQEMQAHLPGYLVPRLAREHPGRPNKTLLA